MAGLLFQILFNQLGYPLQLCWFYSFAGFKVVKAISYFFPPQFTIQFVSLRFRILINTLSASHNLFIFINQSLRFQVSHLDHCQYYRSMMELQNIDSPDISEMDMKGPDLQRHRMKKCTSQYAALFYKSITIQKKNVCTNVCQIVTPLICLFFTLLIGWMVEDKVVSKIFSFPYPQPFNVPGLLSLVPELNASCNEFYLYSSNNQSLPQVNNILSNTQGKYCKQIDKLSPYFTRSTGVNEDVLQAMRDTDQKQFVRHQDMSGNIPDGVINFTTASKDKLEYIFAVNDHKVPEYHRSNGITKLSTKNRMSNTSVQSYLRISEGSMSMIDMITRAYLKTYKPDEILLSSYMYMPFNGEDKSLLMRIINIIGSGLYPIALSVLMPVILYSLVSEREDKLLEMMKMNGLQIFKYWIMSFAFNFGLEVITFSIFFVFGKYILQLTYFTETSSVLMIAVLLGWAIAQLSIANFVQVFINKGRTATVVGYVLCIFMTLIGQTFASGIFPMPTVMPLYMRLYPTFAMCRLFYAMSFACSNGSCYKSIFHIPDEMKSCLLILYVMGALFLTLSIYLNEVVKQDFGVKKSPFFIFQKLFRMKKEPKYFTAVMEESSTFEDDSIQVERQIIKSLSVLHDHPLVVKQISKKYQVSNGRKNYIAVKPLSFTIKNKQIFGLLGPNGAGKTSLISVLTGIYPPTSGTAYINNLSIQAHLDQVRTCIGVCPQFDLLWPELNPEEHLRFYAMLKGVEDDHLNFKIRQTLQEVDLLQFAKLPSCKLSGGMKRRLSIAIALVGNPALVFLDQPSSGLDPEHRRELWNILLKCKTKRSILLTTHSMQQADILCNRIGIITQGSLRCVGKNSVLKEKYGSGYNLAIHIRRGSKQQSAQRIQKIVQYITKTFKINNYELFNNNLRFKIVKQHNTISYIFKQLSKNKSELGIQDWQISQPSLYDVFLKVTEDDE